VIKQIGLSIDSARVTSPQLRIQGGLVNMNRQLLFKIVVIMAGLLGGSLSGIAGPVQAGLTSPSEYSTIGIPPLTHIPALASKPSFTPAKNSLIGSTACQTYYFHPDTVHVGADGIQKIATINAPAGATDQISFQIKRNNPEKIASFYSDPVLAANLTISGPITGFFWANFEGNNVSFTVNLFAYDPATGNKISLGSALTIASSSGGDTQVNFLIAQPPAVPAGRRLLLDFYAQGQNNEHNGSFLYDSPSRDSQFTICQPGPPPPTLVIDKEVVPASVNLGGALTYTIRFTNTGGSAATGSIISDTLPAGTQFTSATLNGTPVAPNLGGNNVYRFSVNSASAPAGNIAVGGSGELVVQTQVSTAFIGSGNLQNVAAISSTEVTNPIADDAAAGIIEVEGPAPHRLYLPLIFGLPSPPSIYTNLYVRSVNTGPLQVQIQDPAAGFAVILTCSVGNNTVGFCGNFMPIGSYKMVAVTTNCGTLEGTFNDADVGPVTRTVFCN
jgi:uncharacterized repeat protein (TIGR01451 family)